MSGAVLGLLGTPNQFVWPHRTAPIVVMAGIPRQPVRAGLVRDSDRPRDVRGSWSGGAHRCKAHGRRTGKQFGRIAPSLERF